MSLLKPEKIDSVGLASLHLGFATVCFMPCVILNLESVGRFVRALLWKRSILCFLSIDLVPFRSVKFRQVE